MSRKSGEIGKPPKGRTLARKKNLHHKLGQQPDHSRNETCDNTKREAEVLQDNINMKQFYELTNNSLTISDNLCTNDTSPCFQANTTYTTTDFGCNKMRMKSDNIL